MNKPKITTKLRLVALCLAAALVLTAMCATSVFATDLPKVTAESKSVHRGQRFEVDVTIGGNTGLTALKLHVGYRQWRTCVCGLIVAACAVDNDIDRQHQG